MRTFAAIGLIAALATAARGDTINVPGTVPTIQGAIDIAESGDVVEVAPGTYFEMIDFLGKAITVRSTDGAETTIIDGSSDKGSVVRFASSEGPGSLLEGFTLIGGSGEVDLQLFLLVGGGVYCVDASPTIRGCHVVENHALVGGGMFAGNNAAPNVEACLFNGNFADFDGGGVACLLGSSALFDACHFEDNLCFDGGGALLSGSAAVFDGCSFADHFVFQDGAGLAVKDGSEAVIRNTTFSGGSACDGGAIQVVDSEVWMSGSMLIDNGAEFSGGGLWATGESSVEVVNTRLLGNSAATGGGLRIAAGVELIAVQALFSGNDADTGGGSSGGGTFLNSAWINNVAQSFDGGGIDCPDGDALTVSNSLLWGNGSGPPSQAGQIACASGAPSLAHCCVQGWNGTLGGPGNFGDDPELIDADGADDQPGTLDDDPAIGPDSPCIDAGDDALAAADLIDVDGDGDLREPLPIDLLANPRHIDGDDDGTTTIDVGPIEYIADGCPADVDGDGEVSVADLVAVVLAWGGSGAADIDGSGAVDGLDLLYVILAWGSCG